MFDCHAHAGDFSSIALVSTASTNEEDSILSFPYRSLGALPGFPSSLEKLSLWAKTHHALGEVGIDRRFPDKDKQILFFRSVLDIAKENDNLLTIHYVGWTGDLISILKDYKGLSFIIHGFTGSMETAREIDRMGGIISLSPKSERASSFSSIISSALPFLTETDMKTGEDEERILFDWTEKLSRLTSRNIEEEVDLWVKESVLPYSM